MKHSGRLVRAMLAEQQAGLCAWCNLPLPENLETGEVALDHIIPRSRGGPDYIWNRQVLHEQCNGPNGKGDKLTPEAERLAAKHGIQLHEPLPCSWPGSSKPLSTGKPNPYRVARETGQPVRRVISDAVKAWLDQHAKVKESP